MVECYQSTASDLPFYDIFAPEKVAFSKIFDDVIACDLWFGPPPQSKIQATPMLIVPPSWWPCSDYFMIGGVHTCLEVSDDTMFRWISSNSCLLNLLLVQSHQAEIIIVKRLIQGRNSVTRVRVEPRSFDQGRG